MKNHLTSLVACAALAVAVGCSKEETPTVANPPRSSDPATEAVKGAVDTVKDQAAATADAAATKVQSLINDAQKFIAEKKWKEALASLNEAAGLKLTDEQKNLVNTLKEQVQKALDATKSLGQDLVPKN
jgi:hypothetical protein